jgi:hypothetical protein
MPRPDTQFDAFLSYSHSQQDRHIARQIADALQARGVNLFMDERTLKPGENWRKAVSDAIRNAEVIIAMVGEDSYLDSFASAEWREIQRRAWRQKDLMVIPIAVGKAQLPPFLHDRQAVRIDPTDSEAGKKVAEAVTELAKVAPSPKRSRNLVHEYDQLQQRLQSIDETAETLFETEGSDERNTSE